MEKDLTLAKSLQIAASMEAAAKEVTELQARSNAGASKEDVHKVITNPNCYHCRKPDHKSAQCPFEGLHCYNCNKVGHVRKVCRQPKQPVRRAPGKGHDSIGR